MAHTLSFLKWQLFACKTQHVFVLSRGHTTNSATSIFGSLQLEFSSMIYISMSVHVKFAVEHSAAFGSSYAPGPFYQVNKLYSFPPLVWTPLDSRPPCALGCSDTNTSLVPFSALWTYKTASSSWSHLEGLWRVKWTTCSCTVVYALATVASLEIKAHKKASRDVDKQIDTKQVLCSSKKVLSCCWLARSVEEVLSWHHHHKIKYTWSSTSQWYLQASPIGGCLHDEVQSYVVGLQRIHEPPSTI